MKLKILVLALLLDFNGFAQQAPVIKVVDIFGNLYNSTEIIEDGKYIFIDFFSNNCSSCQMQIPYVDSVFKYYGCNTDSIIFLAINIDSYSTDQSVFDFCQEFGVSFAAFSGEGGSSLIADNFNVPYTPYYSFIDTNNIIIFDGFVWLDSTEELIDTIDSYTDFNSCRCKGNDFEYFRVISNKDTAFAEIDKINKTVKFNVTMDFDLTNLNAFFISSPKSTVFLDSIMQNSDLSVIDLTDTLYYEIFSEADSIAKEWIVFAERNLSVNKKESSTQHYFFIDNSNIIHFYDFSIIRNYKIYNLSGQLLYKINPTQNKQNLSYLQSGVYLIALQIKEGKLVLGKFTVK